MKVQKVQNTQSFGSLSPKQINALRKEIEKERLERTSIVDRFVKAGMNEKAEKFLMLSKIKEAYMQLKILYGDKALLEKRNAERIRLNQILDSIDEKLYSNIDNKPFTI